MDPVFDIFAAGDFACFSRPEFKVERVSYLAMTPSAARGLLEAIFWKPAFRWRIREIEVLRPIRQIAVMRNELENRQGEKPFFIEDRRQQRTSLLLRDVAYRIRAELVMRQPAREPILKYLEMFQRYVESGQCHQTPYLGLREFPAAFRFATEHDLPIESLSMGLGNMLFDIAFRKDRSRREMNFARHGDERQEVSGFAHPVFFEAQLKNNKMIVPREKYMEIDRLEAN